MPKHKVVHQQATPKACYGCGVTIWTVSKRHCPSCFTGKPLDVDPEWEAVLEKTKAFPKRY